ncbi:MFS transporter [Nocardioides eburneiflavus]|uniref:MFS transporter n=1 Tax=Nocardioides eburneiflavus TaxID=2518372 RepID=A0A4Z1CPN5_9ACTN|nr:MFS transporter [Nocardioides eburneiflavus]
MRRDALRILLATSVSWLGLRMTEVALPLIALQQTGSVWATGLVAGSSGIALLTSPWWSARLRHRLTSGRALAAVLMVQVLGYVTVAVPATLGNLSVVHLCLGGLISGAATSVAGPATRALLADIGDRIGPDVAVRALAWQDLAHRISMVAGPPVAAWVVTQHGAIPLMWADSIAVLLAAVLVSGVGRHAVRRETNGSAPLRVREVLRAHPVVGDGIAMAAVGWFWWFAFALGLAILGAETGRPGQLVAAGMAGYGLGSLAGSAVTPLVVTRLPRVPTMVCQWIVLGMLFAALPWLDGSLLALAVASAVGGFVIPFGLAALNALITEHTSGEERRTAFAAQHVAGSGGSSLGMLTGGAVIAVVGVETTMHVAGVVLIAVPLVLVARAGSSPRRRGGSDVDQPSLCRTSATTPTG